MVNWPTNQYVQKMHTLPLSPQQMSQNPVIPKKLRKLRNNSENVDYFGKSRTADSAFLFRKPDKVKLSRIVKEIRKPVQVQFTSCPDYQA